MSAGKVVKANGSLDQLLIEQLQRAACPPPQVFPCFMRLEIPAVVKKIYSFGQEVGHLEAAKLLTVMEKTTKWSVGKPASIRYRQVSQQWHFFASRYPAVFSCKGSSIKYDF